MKEDQVIHQTHVKRKQKRRKEQISRDLIVREQRRQGQPFHLHEPVNQTNINISNSSSRVVPTTNADTAQTESEPMKCSQADPSIYPGLTIAAPVVESSAQGITTRTVITISTTTTNNTSGRPTNLDNHPKTEEDATEQAEDEDLEFFSSRLSSEEPSDTGPHSHQRPELFECLHCENLRPWPMAALHICMMCIRDWKWCEKGSHNRAKANFMWNGVEHDECYMCFFTSD